MKKRHTKTFLSLCAGLILSLSLGSCQLIVDGDVYISGTDFSEATSDSETESSGDDGDGLTGTGNPYTFGQLKTLLMWNAEDAPDAFEIQRNNRIYEYQGNRNPFVDYPELADYLFPNEAHYFLSY